MVLTGIRQQEAEVIGSKGGTLRVDRVLSPFIDDRPTPHLRTPSFKGWYDVRLSFGHIPLLQEVALQEAPYLHIAIWGGLKNLSFVNAPPQSLLAGGVYTVRAHLIFTCQFQT